ncbi:hypothetical protein, partial [[Clostridium] symbiosum]|uniref:hypothetical protein n=1 Tax=Clostridium symbiosum TaxID=1512 RepID=UPI002ED4673C
MSPPQLIPLTSPIQVIAGTEDSGGSFRGTGHGPLRPLIVSNLFLGAGFVAGRPMNSASYYVHVKQARAKAYLDYQNMNLVG